MVHGGVRLHLRALRWLVRGSAPLAYALGIGALALSAMLLWDGARPPVEIAALPRVAHADKVLHFGAHFVLTSFMGWAALLWPGVGATVRLRVAACAALALDLGLGMAVELVQKHMGARFGRQFEWADLAANAAGAVCAVVVIRVVVRAVLAAYIKRGMASPQSL